MCAQRHRAMQASQEESIAIGGELPARRIGLRSGRSEPNNPNRPRLSASWIPGSGPCVFGIRAPGGPAISFASVAASASAFWIEADRRSISAVASLMARCFSVVVSSQNCLYAANCTCFTRRLREPQNNIPTYRQRDTTIADATQ